VITIVNYGLGNIQAFANIYNRLGIPIAIAENAEQLSQAKKILLPGVGAFDWAMQCLEQSGMRQVLQHMVEIVKTPVLGVCVGMQIMATSSDEGVAAGLGWLDARVRKFDFSGQQGRERLPHMGWNDVSVRRQDSLFADLGDEPRFYFLHSYYFVPNDNTDILATTTYGPEFACAIQRGNVFGVQFHPEKSHRWGVKLLQNFALN
jgi:glutamine amidotransferase